MLMYADVSVKTRLKSARKKNGLPVGNIGFKVDDYLRKKLVNIP